MSTIRDTVREALSDAGLGQYERQADPVIVALEQREAACIEALREYAVNELSSVSDEDAARAMEQAGFDMGAYQRLVSSRPQQQEYTTPADNDMAATIRDLQQQVQELQRVARNAGVMQ